jgi:hypothetical protein
VSATVLSEFDEPRDLLRRIRALARIDPAAARAEEVRLLSGRCWTRWRAELSAAGIRPADVRATIGGIEREVGLWAAGDRPWPALLATVRGRCLRHLSVPSGSEGDAPAS